MSQPMEILIHKGIDGADGATPKAKSPEELKKETAAKKRKEIESTTKAVITAGVHFGKQALLMSVRNHGRITGDSQRQQRIETAINIASYGIATLTGGWIGIAYVGLDLTLKAMNEKSNNDIMSRELERQRARLGRIVGYGR